MKIYSIEECRSLKDEMSVLRQNEPVLKMAAGCEDMVILTAEAMESFRKEKALTPETDPVKLALEHINDRSSILDYICSDHEFIEAERLSLIGELALRVAPSIQRRKPYVKVSDFILEQLADRS